MGTYIISTSDISSAEFITHKLSVDFPDLEKAARCNDLLELQSILLQTLPDFLFLDIDRNVQKLLSFIKQCRQDGFTGAIILFGKNFDSLPIRDLLPYSIGGFLAKPLSPTELSSVFSVLYADYRSAELRKGHLLSNQTYARNDMVRRLLTGTYDSDIFNLLPHDLKSDLYQVILYTGFKISSYRDLPFRLHELLRAAGNDTSSLDYIEAPDYGIILLKGHLAAERFRKFLHHYETSPEIGSPLDSIFVACGSSVRSINEIPISYQQAKYLLNHRFFCHATQHVINNEAITQKKELWPDTPTEKINTYCNQFMKYILSFNRRDINSLLNELTEYLCTIHTDEIEIRLFLTDLFLMIKDQLSKINQSFYSMFPDNASILQFIYRCNYLYEITDYFRQNFDNAISKTSHSPHISVFDNILEYVENNYASSLTLESLSAIFGYNSAYLGKIFTKSLGESFHCYVDRVRINHAKELLENNHRKVYEISEQIGYGNVDYFHRKFKKYTGMTPAEYRKQVSLSSQNKSPLLP